MTADSIYDLITIGGGPGGLMCTLTGVTGIPINPPRHFKALVLDKHQVGQFARYGKLRITHQWSYDGARLVNFLQSEAVSSGIELREGEEVMGVDLSGEVKVVETPRGTYKGRKVALCPGFFPHGQLARCPHSVRVVFSPPELEAAVLPARAGETVAVLGGGRETVDFVSKVRGLRPEVNFLVVLEHVPEVPTKGVDGEMEILSGTLEVVKDTRKGVKIALATSPGSRPRTRKVRFLLVDYNSYTLHTRVTRFLHGTGVSLESGYIRVDERGGAGLPGVFAAGNIVTPVSGVLTALNTGFAAGLRIYEELFVERFGESPLVFPWLPRGGIGRHPLARPEPPPE